MHNFRSHFQWDFLACCTRRVRVRLAMACVGCSLNSFSVFLLSLKQEQNLMKIMFSCIHFPVWPYPPPPPQIMREKQQQQQQQQKQLYFILVKGTAWQVCYVLDARSALYSSLYPLTTWRPRLMLPTWRRSDKTWRQRSEPIAQSWLWQ